MGKGNTHLTSTGAGESLSSVDTVVGGHTHGNNALALVMTGDFDICASYTSGCFSHLALNALTGFYLVITVSNCL